MTERKHQGSGLLPKAASRVLGEGSRVVRRRLGDGGGGRTPSDMESWGSCWTAQQGPASTGFLGKEGQRSWRRLRGLGVSQAGFCSPPAFARRTVLVFPPPLVPGAKPMAPQPPCCAGTEGALTSPGAMFLGSQAFAAGKTGLRGKGRPSDLEETETKPAHPPHAASWSALGGAGAGMRGCQPSGGTERQVGVRREALAEMASGHAEPEEAGNSLISRPPRAHGDSVTVVPGLPSREASLPRWARC